MTPVFQTIREGYGRGNCLQAAFASVLDVPLDSVPHFSRDESDESFYPAIQKWLNTTHALTLICFPESAWCESQPVYHLISGKTAGGTDHVVVAKNGAVVHDPWGNSPERAKDLLSDRLYWFFIAADPATQRRGAVS